MINLELIKQLLNKECITCNVIERIENNNKCSNCVFEIGGWYEPHVNSKFMLVTSISHISKSYLYYFIHHPELNFVVPPTKEGSQGWNLHHKDGNHWNDNIDNTELLTISEHASIHLTERNYSDNPAWRPGVVEKIRQATIKQIEEGRMWYDNPESIASRGIKMAAIRRQQVADGVTAWSTRNIDHPTHELKKRFYEEIIIPFLNSDNDKIEVKKDMIKRYGWGTWQKFTNTIISLIELFHVPIKYERIGGGSPGKPVKSVSIFKESPETIENATDNLVSVSVSRVDSSESKRMASLTV